MENNKNSKGLIVLVIVLIICVLGLGGYIVYDKLSTKPTQTTDNTKSSTTKKIEKEENMFDLIENNTSFPNENDKNVINLELNANNDELLKTYKTHKPILKKIENYEVKYLCTEVGNYFDNEEEGCIKKSVEFNGIIINETNETESCGFSEYMLYNNYIIVANVKGCWEGSYYDLSIYDLNSKKKIYNTNKGYYGKLKITDNKIYYLTINKEYKNNDASNYAEYEYNYFDLKSETNVNIKKFEGIYNPQV